MLEEEAGGGGGRAGDGGWEVGEGEGRRAGERGEIRGITPSYPFVHYTSLSSHLPRFLSDLQFHCSLR